MCEAHEVAADGHVASPPSTPHETIDDKSRDAFVSMLHGTDPHWLVCALLLGSRLQQLCSCGRQRILLIWSQGKEADALACFWCLKPESFLRLPKATRARRHELAFNKILVLGLDVRRALYLDLDILVRSHEIDTLFDIAGPAGMLHGVATWQPKEHGEEVAPDTFQSDIGQWPRSCVNAGVLRLDPPESPEERRRLCEDLWKKASGISEAQATHLPEQYFIVRELEGPWRHIGTRFNWEVGPYIEFKNDRVIVHSSGEWAEVNLEEVVLFHFSGTMCQPQLYFHLEGEDLIASLQERFRWRDCGTHVSTAITEWCQALRKFQEESKNLLCVHEVLEKALEEVDESGRWERQLWWEVCDECQCWAVECFKWFSYGRLCPECILANHCIWTDLPKHFHELVGKWLDIGWNRSAFVVITISSAVIEHGSQLEVDYEKSKGRLIYEDSGRMQLIWFATDCWSGWTIDGFLYGHLISWSNGSWWAHIMSQDEWG
jgi:hypothetical protein